MADQTLTSDAPHLVALLNEMKSGLDAVRAKVQDLTRKVKENQLPTADGMSYLEAKHLLLLGYCQSVVYYLLRKARGLPIANHPVVRNLVETRLFLEKIRPIDKKLEYQIQRLTRGTAKDEPGKTAGVEVKENNEPLEDDDYLKYRPNPDMMVPIEDTSVVDGKGLYRPPRIAPTKMDDDKLSKKEKQEIRREKELLRRTKESSFVKDIMNDLEDRPEELRESLGADSQELSRYLQKREKRDRQEEELFTRAPITKRDKKLEKHMKKSRGGLDGLTDHFFDEIRALPLEEKENDNMTSYKNPSNGEKRFKNRKRKH